jgi:N-acetylneuraminic acid mutarotase/archaellum component FlaC
MPGRVSAEPYEISSSVDDLDVGRVHAATVAIDDMIYIIGGGPQVSGMGDPSPTLDTVLIYDTATGEESWGAPMVKGVGLAAYALADDGKVYVIGGWNGTDFSYYGAVQVYDPVADSWSLTVNGTPEGIGYCASTLGNDGRIYMFGGGWADNATIIYDPSLDQFEYGTSVPTPVGLYGASAVTLSDTQILLVGGVDKLLWAANTTCYMYNPVTDEWSSAAPLNFPRAMHSSVLARNGYAYALGGVNDSEVNGGGLILSSIERYDIAADTWEYASTSLSWARAAQACAQDSYGRIWSLSGYNGATITDVEFLLVSEISGMRELVVTSPTDGSTVNGIVIVEASLVNSFFDLIYGADLFVDGELHESQGYGNYWAFTWDTTGLPDGSVHELLVRGYDYDSSVMDVVVTVTVSAMSADEKLDALEAEMLDLTADLAVLSADLAALQATADEQSADIVALQDAVAAVQTLIDSVSAELAGLADDVDDMGSDVSDRMDDLEAQLDALDGAMAALQTDLDGIQGALDNTQDSVDDVQASVDNKMDGMLGFAIIGLLIVVIVLMMVMMVMGRKPKAPVSIPEPPPVE